MFNLVLIGLLIPFIGTSVGAVCVLFLKRGLSNDYCNSLGGFAAGVMTAASVWSLLIPSIELCENLNRFAFVPATAGFISGVAFLLLTDYLTPKIQNRSVDGKVGKTAMLILAVVLHNIPEGMAVGVAFAGLLSGNTGMTVSSAMMLSTGIAIQNFPEGAIISMPLAAEGMGKSKACLYGILSGIVEPLAGILTLMLSDLIVSILPCLLGFAAGAMIYVVVGRLVPDSVKNEREITGTIMFTVGFLIMMSLDVAFG